MKRVVPSAYSAIGGLSVLVVRAENGDVRTAGGPGGAVGSAREKQQKPASGEIVFGATGV